MSESHDWLRLSGLLVIVLGLGLGLRTTVVVATGGLLTGVLAGLPLLSSAGREGLIDMLGRAFASNRLMTLFIATLPAIALCERHGLQEQSARLIERLRSARPGMLLSAYQLARVLQGLLGFRFNGHPLFVRPLIYPMTLSAAVLHDPEARAYDAELTDRVKAAAAAAENYGNFYGQNLSPVQAGVLLVYGVMTRLHYVVSLADLILYTLPVVLASIVLARVQFAWLERQLKPLIARSA